MYVCGSKQINYKQCTILNLGKIGENILGTYLLVACLRTNYVLVLCKEIWGENMKPILSL